MLTLRPVEKAESHIRGFLSVQICPGDGLRCSDGYSFGAAAVGMLEKGEPASKQ